MMQGDAPAMYARLACRWARMDLLRLSNAMHLLLLKAGRGRGSN
jgi:hypothetical protein